MDSIYQNKYLKYKSKYIDLKEKNEMSGGDNKKYAIFLLNNPNIEYESLQIGATITINELTQLSNDYAFIPHFYKTYHGDKRYGMGIIQKTKQGIEDKSFLFKEHLKILNNNYLDMITEVNKLQYRTDQKGYHPLYSLFKPSDKIDYTHYLILEKNKKSSESKKTNLGKYLREYTIKYIYPPNPE
jgi:hypothetical protein